MMINSVPCCWLHFFPYCIHLLSPLYFIYLRTLKAWRRKNELKNIHNFTLLNATFHATITFGTYAWICPFRFGYLCDWTSRVLGNRLIFSLYSNCLLCENLISRVSFMNLFRSLVRKNILQWFAHPCAYVRSSQLRETILLFSFWS